ncbi:hypothetical protein ZIOFF_036242 [Zingiber officinale]|uniref:Secreted protein n=1 Tax=Zingiber officinale TaxID=94328 RepID=A0A8J5KYF3_ZINOF|nr:hypothetical protein ZIOFF_036242 [Zingiber officinale]
MSSFTFKLHLLILIFPILIHVAWVAQAIDCFPVVFCRRGVSSPVNMRRASPFEYRIPPFWFLFLRILFTLTVRSFPLCVFPFLRRWLLVPHFDLRRRSRSSLADAGFARFTQIPPSCRFLISHFPTQAGGLFLFLVFLDKSAMLGSNDCSMGSRRTTAASGFLQSGEICSLAKLDFESLAMKGRGDPISWGIGCSCVHYGHCFLDSKLVASRANNFCLSNLFAGFVLPSISHQFQLVFFSTLQRFHPLFTNLLAQDLIEMAKEHEETGRMEQMHEQLCFCLLPAPCRKPK